MANTKISALTSATTPLAGTEVLPIVQSSVTVKVATNDLTVRNIRANATTGILQVTGPVDASTRVMTTPNANFTVARTDAAQSFTGDQTLGTGNLVQGTAAKGLNFTANSSAAGMTSQLLNWYEEGGWTPTIYGSSTPGTYTLSNVLAYYTRIGNQVTLWTQFTLSVATGGSGNVRFGGLPINYKAGSAICGTLVINNVNTTTTSPLALALRNTSDLSSNVLYPSLLIDNASFEQIPISGVSTSSDFSFSVTYTAS
jgi:hypothetical protein